MSSAPDLLSLNLGGAPLARESIWGRFAPRTEAGQARCYYLTLRVNERVGACAGGAGRGSPPRGRGTPARFPATSLPGHRHRRRGKAELHVKLSPSLLASEEADGGPKELALPRATSDDWGRPLRAPPQVGGGRGAAQSGALCLSVPCAGPRCALVGGRRTRGRAHAAHPARGRARPSRTSCPISAINRRAPHSLFTSPIGGTIARVSKAEAARTRWPRRTWGLARRSSPARPWPIDYILMFAVGISAGVGALVSVASVLLASTRFPPCLGVLGFLHRS